MPTPQTPLLLVDNLFDTVNLYPSGFLTTSSEIAGHEAYRVASYRRERQSWQAASVAANHWVAVALGEARSVDFIYLDRGHNLWGATISIQYSDDGAVWTTYTAIPLPAEGTLGGDPFTGNRAVTEEGAWWAMFTASPAHTHWRFLVQTAIAPVVTGLMLGLRTQLLGFSGTFDEDAGGRTESSLVSTAGYKGSDTTYSWRTVELDLKYIGSAEYDASIRFLREVLFKRNQPFVCAMDYGTRPERAWMYQYEGNSWGFAKSRVYRSGRIRAREVGASLV